MAEIIIQEVENPWQGDSPAQELIDKLEHNPFGSFVEMEFNSSLAWQPFKASKAVANLKRGRQNSVEFRTEPPFRYSSSIARGNLHNTIVLGMGNLPFRDIDLSKLMKHVGELAALLPRFSRAEIWADYKLNEYYESQHLARVPECFGDFVAWYHLISPLGYGPYFSREEMLCIPGQQVSELENGWIEIISYPDPLAYDQPEARAGIIAITNYLNAHRRDWQKATAQVG